MPSYSPSSLLGGVLQESHHHRRHSPTFSVVESNSQKLSLSAAVAQGRGRPPSPTGSYANNGNSSDGRSNSNQQDDHQIRSQRARHAVEGSLRAILTYLQVNGVSLATIQALQESTEQERFADTLQRAQEYVECVFATRYEWFQQQKNSNNSQQQEQYRAHEEELFDNMQALGHLFVSAWEALNTYLYAKFQSTHRQYTRMRNEHWQEYLVQQQQSPKQRKQRQLRHMMMMEHVDHAQRIKVLEEGVKDLAERYTTSQKGLLLIKEWVQLLHRVRSSRAQ